MRKAVLLFAVFSMVLTQIGYAAPLQDLRPPAANGQPGSAIVGAMHEEISASGNAQSPLLKYREIGEKVWVDGLTLDMLKEGGEFEALVRDHGITGVTTNPTLIKAYLKDKAVLEKARQLAARGLSDDGVYYELIRDLAEKVIQVFKKYNVDGKFSVELDPTKAADVEASVKEALMWSDIDPDYMMVKVAATEEGYRIIEEVTAAGHNVNATLIFTPAQYREVAQAYIRGLEKALAKGYDLSKIYSVASFFISRWDVKLVSRIPQQDQGMFANAIAISAYNRVFRHIFESKEFKALAQKGANVQDFLLASTGSKASKFPEDIRANYPEDVYVSAVQGPNVVNTMPVGTIRFLIGNGVQARATIIENDSAAMDIIENAVARGIKLDVIGTEIFNEGMKSFVDDFNSIKNTITAIRQDATSRYPRVYTCLGEDAMGDVAAENIVDDLEYSIKKNGKVIVLWASAPSQHSTWRALIKIIKQRGIDTSKIICFHMDEYLGLPSDAKQLFANVVRENLFEPLGIPKENIYYFNGQIDPRLSAVHSDEITRMYQEFGGRFDVVVGGIGKGKKPHVAFNSYPTAKFNDSQAVKLIDIDEDSRQQQVDDGEFDRFEDVPKQALTFTLPPILNARKIHIMVPRALKADGVKAMLDGPVSEECPASGLRLAEVAPNTKIYLETQSAFKSKVAKAKLNENGYTLSRRQQRAAALAGIDVNAQGQQFPCARIYSNEFAVVLPEIIEGLGNRAQVAVISQKDTIVPEGVIVASTVEEAKAKLEASAKDIKFASFKFITTKQEPVPSGVELVLVSWEIMAYLDSIADSADELDNLQRDIRELLTNL